MPITNHPGTQQGRVVEALPDGLFRVELEGGVKVVAHPAGRARLGSVRILPGDMVAVEVTAMDPGRARILARLA